MPASSSKWIDSSATNPCPCCNRDERDCLIAEDGETVCCRTRANPDSKFSQPADRIGDYQFTGKIETRGVMDRAIYVKERERTGGKKPVRPKSEQTFLYPAPCGRNIARTKRVDDGKGERFIWQDYWIEDDRLRKHRPKTKEEKNSFWVCVSENKVKAGKATTEERQVYQGIVAELQKNIHLYRISEARSLAKEAGLAVLLVEGEPIVNLLLELGIPATTSIGGAGKWRLYGGKQGNYKADLKGLDVVLCPDCDQVGIDHMSQVSQDYPNTQWLYANPTHRRWQSQPSGGYDLKDWIEELKANNLSDEAIRDRVLGAVGVRREFEFEAEKERREENAVEQGVLKLDKENNGQSVHLPALGTHQVTDEAATPDHHLNIHYFKQGEGDWCVIDGAFYFHNGKNVWGHKPDNDMHKFVANELKELYEMRYQKDGDGYKERRIHKFGSNKNTKSVLEFNRAALTVLSDARQDTSQFINFLNGVLDVKENKLISYDRSSYITTQIQADYIPDSECPTDFVKFVASSFGIEKLELIRAVVRYMIDGSLPYGKFIHLIGDSGSGKGSFIRFLGKIHGQHYKALNDFSFLNTPEGRHQALTGGRMVSFPDLIGALPRLNAFYELVDNGALAGRPLYCSTASTHEWNVRFILGSTEVLQFEKSDTGWDRRVVPIALIRKQGAESDHGLADRLDACKAQVISWAMGMPKDDVVALLWAKQSSELKVEHDRLRDLQAVASDSIKAFIDACLVPEQDAPEGGIDKATVFGYYKAFCEATHHLPKSFNKFAAGMRTALPTGFELSRTSKMEHGVKVNIPARFCKFAPTHRSLFVPKELPNGRTATTEMAQYACNPIYLSEGGLELFRSFFTLSTPSITQATQDKNNSLSKTEPLQSKDYSGYSSYSDQNIHPVEFSEEEKKGFEKDKNIYRAEKNLSNPSSLSNPCPDGVSDPTQAENDYSNSLSNGISLSNEDLHGQDGSSGGTPPGTSGEGVQGRSSGTEQTPPTQRESAKKVRAGTVSVAEGGDQEQTQNHGNGRSDAQPDEPVLKVGDRVVDARTGKTGVITAFDGDVCEIDSDELGGWINRSHLRRC